MASSIPSSSSDPQAVATLLLTRRSNGSYGVKDVDAIKVDATKMGVPGDTWKKLDRNADGFVNQAELGAALADKVPPADLADFRRRAEKKKSAENLMMAGGLVSSTFALGLLMFGRFGAGSLIFALGGAATGAAIGAAGLWKSLSAGGTARQEQAMLKTLD